MEVKGELNTNAPTSWNAKRSLPLKGSSSRTSIPRYAASPQKIGKMRYESCERLPRQTVGRDLTHFYSLHHSPSLQRYVNAVDKGAATSMALNRRPNPKFGFLLETVSCNLVGRRWARRRKRTLPPPPVHRWKKLSQRIASSHK